MSEFYRSFEDIHRGSRQLILSRLAVYQPFIEQLKTQWDLGVLDLGCGRGEWLELLTSMGVRCHGVDTDANMLSACESLGFAVSNNDAISYLKGLPTASQMAVSAFHLVEHIPFDDLQTLVKEAKRVLVPGGLLILETPNPENLRVSTCSFYMDPTHGSPLPPLLLQFLPDHYGYARSIVLRLQESAPLEEINPVLLTHVLNGVSPDYSVIAQTPVEGSSPPEMDALFHASYGVTLEDITAAYDDRSSRLELRAAQTLESLEGLASSFAEAGEEINGLRATSNELASSIDTLSVALTDGIDTLSVAVDDGINALAVTSTAGMNALKRRMSLLEAENRALRTENSTATHALSTQHQQMADVISRLREQDHKLHELAAALEVTRGRIHALSVIIPTPVVSVFKYGALQKSLLRRDGFKGRSKALARRTASFAVRRLSRFTVIKNTAKFVLKKVGAYQYFQDIRAEMTPRDVPIFSPATDGMANIDQENLSAHARTVLAKLKLAEKTRARIR